VSIHDAAISAESGKIVNLFGARHAGVSVDPLWSGSSKPMVASARTISIDALLAHEGIDPASSPVLIKLDVEGSEMSALNGGLNALAGHTAVILEDLEKAGVSEAVKLCLTAPEMDGYALFPDRLKKLSSPQDLLAMRGIFHRIQASPLHIVVTSSLIWKRALDRNAGV
jgi:hypothetical protein